MSSYIYDTFQWCEGRGTNLAEIDDQDENDYLDALIDGNGGESHWFGLDALSAASSQDFTWSISGSSFYERQSAISLEQEKQLPKNSG